jgi:tripartite-type tricarboxylate transporter receptor subunit TctC
LRADFPDPVKGFAPISIVASFPFMLLTHPALPAQSVKDLIALARSKPGALDWGVSSGSFSHLAAAYFVSAANIKVTFIPYKGTGQVLIDALAGRVQAFFGNVLSYLPHVRLGRLRALAISSVERSSALPELPTISESGVPGYDANGWHGWVAPAGTPTAVVSKLSAELARVVRSPDLATTLVRDGGNPVGSTPEQFRQRIAAEVPRWRKVVKDSGMRVE